MGLRGPQPKYPWNTWLRRRRLTLTRGVDYTCEPFAMAIQFRRHAKAAGRRFAIRVHGKKVELEQKGNL